jgi:hypothetical protein
MSHMQKSAILEVVESEKAYVKDLRTIIECFRDPLLAMFKDDARVEHLFGNVKEIERANKELCQRLEKMVGEFADEEDSALFYVSSIFLEMAPKLAVYDRYCKNYERAVDLYAEMMKEPLFSDAVDKQVSFSVLLSTALRLLWHRSQCLVLDCSSFVVVPFSVSFFPLRLARQVDVACWGTAAGGLLDQAGAAHLQVPAAVQGSDRVHGWRPLGHGFAQAGRASNYLLILLCSDCDLCSFVCSLHSLSTNAKHEENSQQL